MTIEHTTINLMKVAILIGVGGIMGTTHILTCEYLGIDGNRTMVAMLIIWGIGTFTETYPVIAIGYILPLGAIYIYVKARELHGN